MTPEEAVSAGGQDEAPRRSVRARLSGCLPVLLLAGVLVGAAVGLPAGTGRGALAARGVVAALVGVLIIVVVRRSLAAIVAPPPPPPATVDAADAEIVYECPTCRTRLRLEVAATGRAPRHCGEEMVPILDPGRRS